LLHQVRPLGTALLWYLPCEARASVRLCASMDPMDSKAAAPAPAPADNEAALVAAAKRGDLAAFEELVHRYERKIFRLGYNITQNREDAQDVVQDAFLKAFEHLGGFQGDSRFYTWLVRIAVNEALMKLRKRRPNLPLDDYVETEDDLIPHEVADWGPTPEQRYAQRELQQILSTAIGQLDPGLRAVFQLRDIDQMSTEETAQALNLSRPAVKSRLLRARLRLRDRLNRVFQGSSRREV
jgi:RNA polymerase sigma-70 factor, ECF subfamily